MNKPRGLGKGLDALFSKRPAPAADEAAAEPKTPATEIPLENILPSENQPRRSFDEALLTELADSIKGYGVLQPILLRKDGDAYRIVAGERRCRAAKMAGLTKIPAIVRDFLPEELTAIALIENLQREDLNAVEEARAYDSLIRDFAMTQEELARRIGRSRSHIANFLRLLKLPERVQESLAESVITVGQVKPLLSLDDAALMQRAADYIIDHDLTVRQAEKLVARLKKDPMLLSSSESRQSAAPSVPKEVTSEAEERLRILLGTKVRVVPGPKKSRLEIEFSSEEDLSRIMEILMKHNEDLLEAKKRLLRQVSRSLAD